MNSKYAKREILRTGVKIIERVGRLYIVDSSAPFACIRFWGWCIARENHEKIKGLRKEFKDSLHQPPSHHVITDTLGYRISKDGHVYQVTTRRLKYN